MQILTQEVTRTTEEVGLADADPVLSNTALPLRALYFPLGFPLEIATNSQAVLAAAAQSWGLCRPRFSCPPLTLRLGVIGDRSDSLDIPPVPVCRIQKNLISTIADAHNFVITDLAAGFSFGSVTPQAAESALYLRYHFLEAATLCMVAALRAAPLHAACVIPSGRGMLLCGDSGAGKSTLAFAGARSGWTLVCDDSSYLPLDRTDRLVLGNCHQIRLRDSCVQLFPELEGRPVTPRASGKPSVELLTADFPDIRTANSATVEYVVFLNRQNAKTSKLVPFSRESAVSWFNQFSVKTTPSQSAQEAAIRHLLDVEIFELRYTDLDWAIERIQTLAITGR
ncbi:MAG: aldolase [Silvibacterium sp.]